MKLFIHSQTDMEQVLKFEKRKVSSNWHGDVIKWKHFSRYWSLVRGINKSPVNSPLTNVSDAGLWYFFWSKPKRLSKQSWGWWFETPSPLLWRQYNGYNHFSTLGLAYNPYLLLKGPGWKVRDTSPWTKMMPSMSFTIDNIETLFNTLSLGGVYVNFRVCNFWTRSNNRYFSNFPIKLPSSECHKTHVS